MADRTKIAWTDATWSPVSGCTKVSAGCANCYISRTPPFRKAHRRFERVGNSMTTGVQLHPDRLDQPLHWRKPRRIFVCSMSDLFHEEVPDQFIAQVFWTMVLAQRHTFQILTKRPDRLIELLRTWERRQICADFNDAVGWPVPNVWLGVSVENQYWADRRTPLLLQTPAAVRFLSLEPLLKPVKLWDFIQHVDWVIVGGESGPKHRPMDLDWVREIRAECRAAGTAFFYKQPSGLRPGGEALLDGKEYRQWPIPRNAPESALDEGRAG